MDINIRFIDKYKGLDVYESPDCQSPMSIITIKKENKRAILYNGKMCYDFPTQEFNALLEHEIGHIHLKHSTNERDINNEIEADLYSAKVVGIDTTIQALEMTLYIVKKLNHKYAKEELIQRIKSLEEYKNNI
ncbi:hypothetical protein [Clostridium sp.]|uniref:hypothetical protein n=1 Tax=Clostridium sp. TaxID=1506 RepID=UPI002FC9238E